MTVGLESFDDESADWGDEDEGEAPKCILCGKWCGPEGWYEEGNDCNDG